MTVVFLTNAGTPVLAGDMLVSMPGPSAHTSLRLPSQPTGIVIPSDARPRYVPIRMRRKTFIVNDHMAAGASGSEQHISMFRADLFEEFQHRPTFSQSDIETFFDQYRASSRGSEVLENAGAIVLTEATDRTGYAVAGKANHKRVLSQRLGQVVAIGSGAGSIIEQVGKTYNMGRAQPPDGGAGFPEFNSLAANLHLLGNMYWEEFVSARNLFDGWGGAYDLIYQDSTKAFRHLNDYTIFLRLLDIDHIDAGLQLWSVLRYERRSDFSFIMLVNGDIWDVFGAKDITPSAYSVDVTFNKDELTMNSEVHVVVVAVVKGNRRLAPIVYIEGLDSSGKGNRTVFSEYDETRGLEVLFHSERDKWLKEQVMTYYEERAYLFD
ncbi:MAG: hypothetical protein F4X66_10925 [Chloroflexi bacterium]|nr:hypothetical protein [Chloroflexota bacterium]MYE41263.1 hypothetical protein [Chloroflexota bacterium]